MRKMRSIKWQQCVHQLGNGAADLLCVYAISGRVFNNNVFFRYCPDWGCTPEYNNCNVVRVTTFRAQQLRKVLGGALGVPEKHTP